MYNFSVFYCKRNTISPKERDFLVETPTISSFPCESISRFWKSEHRPNQSFLFYFNGDSGDKIRSEFGNFAFCRRRYFPKIFFCFDNIQLLSVEKEVNPLYFFPSRFRHGKSFGPFFDLGTTEIDGNSEVIPDFEDSGGGGTISIYCISSRMGSYGNKSFTYEDLLMKRFLLLNFCIDVSHTL
jgi:hypothetical protein